MKKEIAVCKFNDTIPCSSYVCEEDLTSLATTKATCPLNQKHREKTEQIENAKKLLDNFPKCRVFDHVTLKFAEEEPDIKNWLNKLQDCLRT